MAGPLSLPIPTPTECPPIDTTPASLTAVCNVPSICTQTHTPANMHVHTHACTHTCMHTYTGTHTCTCMRVHTHSATAPHPRLLHSPPTCSGVFLPVVVAVDRCLAGEAQHPAHHPAVVPGPALVTHLPPVALVLHLHGPLSHRALPLGAGEDGLEPYLLQPPVLQDMWSLWAPGVLPLLSPLQVFTWESWGSEHLEIMPPSTHIGWAGNGGSEMGRQGPRAHSEYETEAQFV